MPADDSGVIEAERPVRTRRLTSEEFMTAVEAGAFPDVPQIELVDGELVEMPPEGSLHAVNVKRTLLVLERIVQRHPPLELASGMAVGLGAGRVVGPDAVVFVPQPGWPATTPASAVRLAVEHSFSTRRYDLTRKADLYAEAGVPEYWVLDDVEPRLHRFHTPSGGAYLRDPPLGVDAVVEVPFAPGEHVRVGDLFRLD